MTGRAWCLVAAVAAAAVACTVPTAAAAGGAAAAAIWRLQADGVLSAEDAAAIIDAMGGAWWQPIAAGLVGAGAAQGAQVVRTRRARRSTPPAP